MESSRAVAAGRRLPTVLLLASIVMDVPSAHAFAPHRSSTSNRLTPMAASASADRLSGTRRLFVASTLAIVPFLGWNDAHALQEKNELLCNTGFFTNVGAWYCTDIGNIGDEGQSKPMSGEAEASVDSLLSKFDIGGGDFGDGKRAGETKRQSSKEPKREVDVTAMGAKE